MLFPGEDIYIVLNPVAGQKEVVYTYTVVLSPQPLAQYDFLNTAELRSLTETEVGQLDNLRRQATAQGDVVSVETSATNKWLRNVSLPAQLGSDKKDPRRIVIFEISLRVQ